MPHKPLPERLEPHRQELLGLLQGIASARDAAVERALQRKSWLSRTGSVAGEVVGAALKTTGQIRRLGGGLILVCLAFVAKGLWVYFAEPDANMLTEALLPVLLGAALFVVVPSLLFGWLHLFPAIRRHFGNMGAGPLLSARPQIFVAQAFDVVTQKLTGHVIDGETVERASLPRTDVATSDVVPCAYVEVRLRKSGAALALVNASTGRFHVWTQGVRLLEERSELFVEFFLDELRRAGHVESLQELAEIAGSQRPAQRSEASGLAGRPKTVEASVRSTWEDLIVNEGFKEELRSFVEMLKSAGALRARGFEPPDSLLLYGPPGTGKTQVARTLASMSGVSFMACSASSLKAEHIGASAPKVAGLFDKARGQSPCILFIDEIESAVSRRDGEAQEKDRISDEVVAEMLVQMDGTVRREGDVFLIAATNFPNKLDTAVLNRFKLKKEIGLPDFSARRRMLDIFLQGKPQQWGLDAVLDGVALRAEGQSGRELRALVDAAALKAVQRSLRQGSVDTTEILAEDFGP